MSAEQRVISMNGRPGNIIRNYSTKLHYSTKHIRRCFLSCHTIDLLSSFSLFGYNSINILDTGLAASTHHKRQCTESPIIVFPGRLFKREWLW